MGYNFFASDSTYSIFPPKIKNRYSNFRHIFMTGKPLNLATAYKGLSKEQIPHASSATRIIQQIGGAFGAAVFAAILGNQLTHSSVINISVEASAFSYTFFWSLVFILPALILAIFIPGNKSNTQLVHEGTM